MRCLTPMTAFLVVAVLLHSDVRGQDGDTPSEMKALERLVGTWKVEQIVKVPEEAGSTSLVVKNELVLGDGFVQATKSLDDKGNPSFMAMYTYDSKRETYRFWFFLSGGFYTESTGTWDERSQTFTFIQTPKRGVTGMATMRFLDETTISHSTIVRDASGKISYHQEGRSVRQK